jgi:diaminopimelate decarboxylase
MDNLAGTLAQKYFGVRNSELLVGGVPVRVLAESYGTPAFVYDGGVLDRKLDALLAALPKRFRICYSMKANPNQAVLRHFLSRGCGLEIASAGEFRQGLEAGCEAGSMLFAGPGKTEAELEQVLSRGIGEIHLESLLEAARVGAISRRLGIRARVAIRVNPAAQAEGGAMRMGGRPAPFGVDEETLDEVVDAVMSDASLEFRGIHLFTGTQILDASLLVNQYRHGLEVGRRAAKRAGRGLHRLDFGGGLGIPYFAHEQPLDLEELRAGLVGPFAEIEGEECFAETEFLVEPGRFLVGEAGVYLTRINDIKVSRGKKFLIVDGGMNHHLAASGNLGQTIKRNYPVALLNKMDAPADEAVDVVGPLCTPLDTLARGINLPKAEVGDLLGIFQSGAYARAASPLHFLSHSTPPEIWVERGEHWLTRKRGDTAEAMYGTVDELRLAKS